MKKNKLKYYSVIGFVLLSGLLASFAIYKFFHKTETVRAQAVFNRNCEAIRVSIQREIEKSSDVLYAIKANIVSHKGMTREQFRTAVKYLLKNNNAVKVIGVCPIVSLSQRDSVERKAREEGLTHFRFTELKNEKLVTAGERAVYYPLYYVEPYANNKDVPGFDLASNPTRKAALERAATTGEITATEPITHVQQLQDNKDDQSVLIYVAVYEDELGISKRHKPYLFLSAGIHIGSLINKAISLIDDSSSNSLEVIDISTKNKITLFSNKQKDTHYSYSKSASFPVANRMWELHFNAPSERGGFELYFQTNVIPVVILLITIFISVLLSRILKDDRKELEATNFQLKKEVAEREETEKQLKEISERYSLIFEKNSVAMVMTNMETSILEYANESFFSIFGFERDEVIGKKNSELRIVTDEFREKAISLIKQNGFLKNVEGEAHKKNGDKFWILYSSYVIEANKKKYILSSVFDMDERRKMEERIRELIEFQKIVFNASDYAIITTSHPDGIITSFNKGAERMLGYKSAEVIGKTSPEIIHDSTEVEAKAVALSKELNMEVKPGIDVFHLKSRLGEATDVGEWTYIRKDGSRVPVELSITTLFNQEKGIVGYLGIAKDISESKKAKEAMLHAKEAAEKANRLKETFLANMSHEIRTPMNAIIGFTDLLLKRDLREQEKDFVKTIKNSGENLLRIINDILDVSKIDSGTMVFEEHPISIKELFGSLNSMLFHKAEEKRLSLIFDCHKAIPDTVLGDPTRLTQIIVNIVGNAIKFTEKGSIEVLAKTLREDNDFSFVEFSVKDTGIGIDEDKLAHIFERFTQAESYTTRYYGGTGLGLNIAKQLVELQKGTISVQSTLGVGTVFSFVLPLKKTDEIISAEHDYGSKEVVNIDKMNALSVLLVEDNPINIKFVMSLFSDHNIQADLAENGQLAVEKIMKKRYDIVLMDIEMPVMNGYEATSVIRNELKSNVPIIAMTAHALAGEREKCIQAGMNDYLSKPIDSALLFRKMFDSATSKAPDIVKAEQNNRLVNLDFLVSSMSGKNDVILEIIDIFLHDFPEDLAALKAVVEEVDYSFIKRYAHKMRSTVSVMGISDLETILIEMEGLSKAEKDIERIKQLYQTLNDKSKQAMEEVKLEKIKYV